MIKASGLWLNEDTKGNKYFSGNLGQVRIVIFKNNFKKEGSNEPDYQMYFDESTKKDTKETTSKVDSPIEDIVTGLDIPF